MALTKTEEFSPVAITGELCLLAAFIFSLFFDGYADIIYAPASLLLLVMAGLAIIPCFWRTVEIPVGKTALFLFLLWLYITVSLTWSTVPFTSLVTYIVFISLPLVFLALSVPENRKAWLTISGIGILIAMGGLGGWAIFQHFFSPGIYGSRAGGPFINPNNLAALLNMGLLPVMAFLIHRRRHDATCFGALALYTLMLGGVLATESRSGFMFLLVSAFTLCFILRRQINMHKQSIAFLIVIAAVLLGIMHAQGSGEFSHRMASLAAPLEDHSALSRISIWTQAFLMLKAHPWTGTGFGTFYLYYPAYRMPMADDSTGNWAHMDSLQFGIETGIAATILFYLFLASVLARTVNALSSLPPESGQRSAVAGLFCGLLAVALDAHVSFPLYLMPILIVCGVWLAGWYSLTAPENEPAYKAHAFKKGERPVVAVAAICVTLLLALLAVSSAAGQHYLVKATDAISKGHVGEFLENIEKAQLRGPASFIDPEVQTAGFYIDILGGADVMFPNDEQRKMFDDSIAMLDAAASMNPAWAEIDYKRGKLYDVIKPELVPGGKEQAREFWQIALRKNPMHDRARLALAKSYMAAGDPAKAYDLLKAGMEYPMNQEIFNSFGGIMKQIDELAKIQKAYREQQATTVAPAGEASP
jgi:putative inorganic carbon (hco3(-)) transporter